MTNARLKSSLYLSAELHERVKAHSKATQLPLNTHLILALEEYLQQERRAELVERELEASRR